MSLIYVESLIEKNNLTIGIKIKIYNTIVLPYNVWLKEAKKPMTPKKPMKKKTNGGRNVLFKANTGGEQTAKDKK